MLLLRRLNRILVKNPRRKRKLPRSSLTSLVNLSVRNFQLNSFAISNVVSTTVPSTRRRSSTSTSIRRMRRKSVVSTTVKRSLRSTLRILRLLLNRGNSISKASVIQRMSVTLINVLSLVRKLVLSSLLNKLLPSNRDLRRERTIQLGS